MLDIWVPYLWTRMGEVSIMLEYQGGQSASRSDVMPVSSNDEAGWSTPMIFRSSYLAHTKSSKEQQKTALRVSFVSIVNAHNQRCEETGMKCGGSTPLGILWSSRRFLPRGQFLLTALISFRWSNRKGWTALNRSELLTDADFYRISGLKELITEIRARQHGSY